MAEIHIIGDDGDIEVWLDTEIANADGIVIGLGATRLEALESARTELQARLADVEALLHKRGRPRRGEART